MKILHVMPGMEAALGGPVEAVLAMTRGLAEQGLNVTLATTHEPPAPSAGEAPRPARLHPQVAWRSFPRLRRVPGWYAPTLGAWLSRHAGEFDLVHVHFVFTYPTQAAARAARRAQVPYIVRPLGMLSPWSLRQKAWKKRLYYGLLEKRRLAHAAALHATSQAELDDLRALGWQNAVLAPLGIDLPTRPERRPEADGLRALFLSRIHPKKNLETLLRAVAAAGPAVRLRIAGEGEFAYLAQLRQLCDELGIQRQVEFVGWAGGERKRELLASSDVFVLPSFHENFGVAVAEAMAMELPALISDGVALAAEVRDSDAGAVLPARDVAAWSAALHSMLAPEPRLRQGRNARRLVEQHWTYGAMTARLVELYQELARPPR